MLLRVATNTQTLRLDPVDGSRAVMVTEVVLLFASESLLRLGTFGSSFQASAGVPPHPSGHEFGRLRSTVDEHPPTRFILIFSTLRLFRVDML